MIITDDKQAQQSSNITWLDQRVSETGREGGRERERDESHISCF